jgi:hypothetical protein
MRLTEQASLTLFEVPDIDTSHSRRRLPSAIAKMVRASDLHPPTVLPEVWDYIRFDRAVLIEQARRRGIYDRIPAKLLVEDPQYAAVAPRSAGGRRRPVETLDPRQRRRLFICGTEGLEPLCSAWSPLP